MQSKRQISLGEITAAQTLNDALLDSGYVPICWHISKSCKVLSSSFRLLLL